MLKNILKYIAIIGCLCVFFAIFTRIKNTITNSYTHDKDIYVVDDSANYNDYIDSYRDNTLVVPQDDVNASLFSDCFYALLVDDTNHEIIVARNPHIPMSPASMTKLMTAIIVVEKIESGEISLDDEIVVTKKYDMTDRGSAPFYIEVGSVLKLKDVLYDMLIASNNYYTLLLADHIAGSEEAFCDLMNKKAYEIGARNTNYKNPHGLDEDFHGSTPYDTYLIIKEAYSHEIIREIDKYTEYTYTYTTATGYEVEESVMSTNLFSHDMAKLPSGYIMHTWKTGTTSEAGYCLAMILTKDDHTYISITATHTGREELYDYIIRTLSIQ